MTKNQRIFIFILLVALLAVLVVFPPTAPEIAPPLQAILFTSLLFLSFAALLVEPYFARPTDVVAAGASILLLLGPSRELLSNWGVWYWYFAGYVLAAVVVAVTALLLLNGEKSPNALQNRLSDFLKSVATRLASGKVQYFILFLLTLIFFVPPATTSFISLSLYAGLVVLIEPRSLGRWLPTSLGRKQTSVGVLLGVQGPNTFLVKLHARAKHSPVRVGDLLEFRYGMDGEGVVRRAIVLEQFYLDDTLWLRALCHPEIEVRAADLAFLPNHESGEVYVRAQENVAGFLDDVLGVVQHGSEIGTLKFQQVGRGRAHEGELVQVPSQGAAVLCQVVKAPGNFYECGGYRDRGEKQKYYTGEIPHDYVLDEGDLLIAMTEQAAGLLGSPILVPESDRFLHNQRLGLVTNRPGVVWTNEFFFHVFNTQSVRNAIHSSASGVKVRHTSPTKIGEVVVSFPTSLQEQKRIVTTLASLTVETQRLTRIYERKRAALDALKKSLLHEAFSGNL